MDRKAKWHRCAIALMGRVARDLDIPKDERTIRSNKGGNAVGGEVTMSAPKFGVYVHLACPWNSYNEEDHISSCYVRRATPDDPYGSGMDKPNHCFKYLSGNELLNLIRKVSNG